MIASLANRTGRIIDSQEEFRTKTGDLPGIDDVPTAIRQSDFDSDGDGMPNEFEAANQLDPHNAEDRNGSQLSPEGYTNLEVYLNSLAVEPERP